MVAFPSSPVPGLSSKQKWCAWSTYGRAGVVGGGGFGHGVLPSCDEAAASSSLFPNSERRERSNGHGPLFVDNNRRAGLAARRCLSCFFGGASELVIDGVTADGGRWLLPPALHGRDIGWWRHVSTAEDGGGFPSGRL
nr:hypothetical protein Iba_chr02bCG14050 [Ipomoea batatas]